MRHDLHECDPMSIWCAFHDEATILRKIDNETRRRRHPFKHRCISDWITGGNSYAMSGRIVLSDRDHGIRLLMHRMIFAAGRHRDHHHQECYRFDCDVGAGRGRASVVALNMLTVMA